MITGLSSVSIVFRMNLSKEIRGTESLRLATYACGVSIRRIESSIGTGMLAASARSPILYQRHGSRTFASIPSDSRKSVGGEHGKRGFNVDRVPNRRSGG